MGNRKTFTELGKNEAIKLLFSNTGYEPFHEPVSFICKEGDYATTATRLFSEGVDFNLVYFPLKHLGYKSVISVTGELYAVMSGAETLSVVLGVSAKLDFDQVKEIWDGIVTAAREQGYKQLSLDLQPSRNGLYISVSASGIATKDLCDGRPAAQSKDLICVSGALGAAYLGMQLLERNIEDFNKGKDTGRNLEKYKMLAASYLKPELQSNIVDTLRDSGIVPSMGYFISNGLADTLLKLSRDSGLGVKVYAEKIPFEGGSFEIGKKFDIDPVSAAMNGGDDFRLLFTVPILQLEKFRRDFQSFDIIGHLALPEAGTTLVTPEGVELPISAQGWSK